MGIPWHRNLFHKMKDNFHVPVNEISVKIRLPYVLPGQIACIWTVKCVTLCHWSLSRRPANRSAARLFLTELMNSKFVLLGVSNTSTAL